MSKDDDDEVGYGKPPVKNQFKKGQSGNPNGRPKKKDKSYFDKFSDEMLKEVYITENGEKKKATRLDIFFRNLSNETAKLNPKILKHSVPLIQEMLKQKEKEECQVHVYLPDNGRNDPAHENTEKVTLNEYGYLDEEK